MSDLVRVTKDNVSLNVSQNFLIVVLSGTMSKITVVKRKFVFGSSLLKNIFDTNQLIQLKRNLICMIFLSLVIADIHVYLSNIIESCPFSG